MSLSQVVETYLHHHIPMSEYMGAKVVDASPQVVRISFPLAPNINHRQTAFGGSISTAAILSAWSLLWVRLADCNPRPRLLIMSNTTTYLEPIETDFIAESCPIPSEGWTRFRSTLARKGKARIALRSKVMVGTTVCGELEGTFVALS